MSLESYFRDIEAQKERDLKRVKTSESSNIEVQVEHPQMIYVERKKCRGCSTPFILAIFMMTIVIAIAAIKNPSQANANAHIKSYLVERISDYVALKTSEDTESSELSKGFGRLLINALAPSFIDAMVQIQTSDYVFFSTFEAKVENKGEHKKLMSGVILFGKIIPLSTDLDKDKLKESGFDL